MDDVELNDELVAAATRSPEPGRLGEKGAGKTHALLGQVRSSGGQVVILGAPAVEA